MLGRHRATSRLLEGIALGVQRTLSRLVVDPVPPVVQTGGAIVVANHRSVCDALFGIVLLRGVHAPVRYLVAERFFHRPLTGRLLRLIGAIPVPADRPARDAMRAAIDALRDGAIVVIMPEGRVAPRGLPRNEVLPFARGVDLLIRRAHAPVLCAAIVGADDVWPADARLPRLRPWRRPTVRLRFTVLEGPDTSVLAAEHAVTHLLNEMLVAAP